MEKVKIGFVSMMRNVAWGGSEELWSKTALQALAQGHAVESLTYGWEQVIPRIAALQAAGVDTKFYYPDSRAVLERMAVRTGLKTARSETLPNLQADILVFSIGSVWDFIRYRPLTDKLIGLGKPYILLVHNTFDHGDIVPESSRDYAISVLQKAVKVLFVSDRNKEGAERQLAYTLSNAQVVSNPVNIRKAFIKPYPSSDKLLMASVGLIECGVKGQDLLLEALSGADWRNRDFLLRIYGTGPHVQYLQHLIKVYNLQGKVTLEGHVADIDHIWENNQVLVLSSTTEGGPMVVVEAMLSGRAVVGTDVGIVEHYIIEGNTGFLVEVAKAKYLRAGLEKLWSKKDSLKQIGENAFHHAVNITNSSPEESFLNIIKSAI